MLVSADFESYIQYFLYGGVELGISYATGKEDFRYPFVWLEQPDIVSDENDMTQLSAIYYGGINVITCAPLDGHAAQIQACITFRKK